MIEVGRDPNPTIGFEKIPLFVRLVSHHADGLVLPHDSILGDVVDGKLKPCGSRSTFFSRASILKYVAAESATAHVDSVNNTVIVSQHVVGKEA